MSLLSHMNQLSVWLSAADCHSCPITCVVCLCGTLLCLEIGKSHLGQVLKVNEKKSDRELPTQN